MNDVVLCKDCKHSFRSISEFFAWGSGVEWRCRKAYKAEETEQDLVVGPKQKPAHFERCSMARGKWNDSTCGKEGKLWEPKNPKKFMFKIIKHEEIANG